MTKEELVFVPLGGLGEIGMNLALYGVGPAGSPRWLMVDCGVTFADPTIPGIDLIMPDIRFIEEDRQALEGIVITHAHEDHIGALLDLWPKLRCKVYATPFTAGLIAAKCEEEQGAPKIPITIVRPGARLDIGPFDIEFINVAHSVPEAQSIAIRTKVGRVLHTGDWKIDPTPTLGDVTDMERFAAFGAEGVDAVIGDSTNSTREGSSPSEKEVGETLTQLIAQAKGRVGVVLFASNIARVASIAQAAMANGRSVVVIGRALQRAIRVAKDVGYLQDLPEFLSMDVYSDLPRSNVVALMTGSQGEPRSALARVARGDHPYVSLARGDTVVFSSRTIPGNERSVGQMLNGLVTQGIKIITDKDALVHVSGHPRIDEIKQLYSVLKPAALVPAHGEPFHMAAHARLGRSIGIKQVEIATNGAVMRLAPGPLKIVDWIYAGRLLKDGKLLLPEAEDQTVGERKKLQWSGSVSIAIAVNKTGDIMDAPHIQMTGVPKQGVSGKAMLSVIEAAVMGCLNGMPKPRRRDKAMVSEAISRAVRSHVDQEWGKKPVCHIAILAV